MSVLLLLYILTGLLGLGLVAISVAAVYRQYLPDPSAARGTVWLAIAMGTAGFLSELFPRITQPQADELLRDRPFILLLPVVSYMTMSVFLAPLLVKQWQLWFANNGAGLKAPTSPPILSRSDAACIVLVVVWALLASKGWHQQLSLLAGVVAVGAPIVGPLARLTTYEARSSVTAASVAGDERQRVLALLEQGQISADDAADLLGALGQSAGVSQPVELSRAQKLLLVGAAVVLVGFLLPWFAVNVGEEMRRAWGQVRVTMPTLFPVEPFAKAPTELVETPTTYIAGGDLDRGVGWLILGLSVGIAAMPFVTSMTESSRHTVSLVLLGVGGFLILYLFTQGWRHVSIGLIVVIAGYALQTAALLRRGFTTWPAVVAEGGAA